MLLLLTVVLSKGDPRKSSGSTFISRSSSSGGTVDTPYERGGCIIWVLISGLFLKVTTRTDETKLTSLSSCLALFMMPWNCAIVQAFHASFDVGVQSRSSWSNLEENEARLSNKDGEKTYAPREV